MLLRLLLYLAGAFTFVLGCVHLALPALLGYRQVLLNQPVTVKPFTLPLSGYRVQARDLYGIIWVMNHSASYGLISIGLLDLLGAGWLLSAGGRWLALWIAGWWLVRSASQFYLGRRRGDWLIALGFLGLGLIHLAVFLT
ncbi:MAG: hypothetical protein PVF47_21010 [Anaerolineae bacterium]|jgi:hypothetical protein